MTEKELDFQKGRHWVSQQWSKTVKQQNVEEPENNWVISVHVHLLESRRALLISPMTKWNAIQDYTHHCSELGLSQLCYFKAQ